MENSLYVALSQQMAVRRMLDVTANNVANMNTAAFRAERPVFDAFVEKAGKGQKVAFVIDRATYTDTRDGTVASTGNPLDVAVRGDAWLSVATPDGIRYTRDGRLNRDPDGRLVTLDGYPVLDEGGGEITLPEDVGAIAITADGAIRAPAVDSENGEVEELGRLGLARLPAAGDLERDGSGLVRYDGDPLPAEGATLIQGAVEGSNVQPITEMVRLVELTRAYGQANRMVESEHERQKTAISKLGGPAT
ncbi:flagellar basal-body rod protein FlgF [Rhodospirillum centenum]|uniref:Flagellar basal-body rod protein FlgF n=1 Tax=Rhodospirillum centenum (strain ATCC 51521 / SW) TaxID=414684 RepID=B6IQD0_RHOCS|nr:flagellar basal-body rod protein FlgF [Rhodospirillum centenum]ACI97666.1 flagellar basal-body rod protein FlgF [Rhodospirillum centenum SW]